MALTPAGKNADLDDSYTGGPYQIALFNGDPLGTGTELTAAGGYARATLTSGALGAAALQVRANSAVISFPTSTAAWSTVLPNFFAVFAADGTTMLETGVVTLIGAIDAAGKVVRIPINALTFGF